MSAASRAHGRLYLVPNLLGLVPPPAVLPQRTIDIARGLAYFVVETPKAARRFLKTLGPSRPLQELRLSELNRSSQTGGSAIIRAFRRVTRPSPAPYL